MMRFAVVPFAVALFLGFPVSADAPVTSPRPEARADSAAATRPGVAQPDGAVPRSRPKVIEVVTGGIVARAPRPPARPENLRRKATVAAAGFRAPAPPVVIGAQGSVCGDPAIRGAPMSSIAGRIRGCGIQSPVRISSVAGIALSVGATMDCTTARALKTWVERGAKPAVGRLGGGIASLKVAAHYSCRTRNNRKGAKISEHGKGRAIDISAIVLRNGVAMTVLDGWRSAQHGKILRTMHRAACGPFGTVLGPNADRYHQDHFHFDTARYRNGSYCK